MAIVISYNEQHIIRIFSAAMNVQKMPRKKEEKQFSISNKKHRIEMRVVLDCIYGIYCKVNWLVLSRCFFSPFGEKKIIIIIINTQ